MTDIERDVDAATGELVWRFSRTFREIVKNSTHWASISARAVMEMECKYSPWLYQLCALHAGRRQVTRDWPLAVLRERLGASAPSMQRWQDFKRYALEPAVAEVNHLTGIAVTWAPVKIGREVVAVRLACSRKQPPEIAAAAAEINRPRVGRRARRAGTVEQIASEQGARRRAIAEELAALPPFPPRSDD
ncbi:MAG: replication initiation protein [Alphaproteobacteria bacterium]|nr:replication initiation protein [Alphaproteobacteria bacterium]